MVAALPGSRRGEVWWADLPPPAGRRPVVLISRDDAYRVRALVTIAPVTTHIRGIPAEVSLGPAEGLARSCVINCDSITTIPRASLRDWITTLNWSKMDELDSAIAFALGLGWR